MGAENPEWKAVWWATEAPGEALLQAEEDSVLPLLAIG